MKKVSINSMRNAWMGSGIDCLGGLLRSHFLKLYTLSAVLNLSACLDQSRPQYRNDVVRDSTIPNNEGNRFSSPDAQAPVPPSRIQGLDRVAEQSMSRWDQGLAEALWSLIQDQPNYQLRIGLAEIDILQRSLVRFARSQKLDAPDFDETDIIDFRKLDCIRPRDQARSLDNEITFYQRLYRRDVHDCYFSISNKWNLLLNRLLKGKSVSVRYRNEFRFRDIHSMAELLEWAKTRDIRFEVQYRVYLAPLMNLYRADVPIDQVEAEIPTPIWFETGVTLPSGRQFLSPAIQNDFLIRISEAELSDQIPRNLARWGENLKSRFGIWQTIQNDWFQLPSSELFKNIEQRIYFGERRFVFDENLDHLPKWVGGRVIDRLSEGQLLQFFEHAELVHQAFEAFYRALGRKLPQGMNHVFGVSTDSAAVLYRSMFAERTATYPLLRFEALEMPDDFPLKSVWDSTPRDRKSDLGRNDLLVHMRARALNSYPFHHPADNLFAEYESLFRELQQFDAQVEAQGDPDGHPESNDWIYEFDPAENTTTENGILGNEKEDQTP